MALTTQHVLDQIRHALGGELAPEMRGLRIVNEAGRHLAAMHQWNFYKRPSLELALRAPASTTAATWTALTNTLTSNGSFASYAYLEGDQYEVTGGTGATLGLYRIISKTDNTLVLETQLATVNLTGGNIAGNISPTGIALPSDFSEVISLETTNSLTSDVIWTEPEELLLLRTKQIAQGSLNRWVTIVWGQSDTSLNVKGGEPTPRLEVWPIPSAADADAFTMFYRAGWDEITTSAMRISLPKHLEALYLQLVRAWAKGYEEDDIGMLDARIAAIEAGPLYRAARRQDGRQQPSTGPIRNGWMTGASGRGQNQFANLDVTVQNPS